MAKLKLGVDVGGTFTDVVGINEDGKVYFAKTPSTPEDQSIGVLNGIRALLEELGVAPDCVTGVAHGTTVATNTLLERNGAVTALITTKGFRDVLDIGRQSRPELYDLHARKPASLIPRYLRREADERMDYTGTVLVQLDMEELKKTIHELMEEGAESIAICFLHSYANDENEKKALEVIREIAPDFPVSVSSEILPEFREFERMNTTVMNAYVQPRMQKYVSQLRRRLDENGINSPLTIMQSSGGMMTDQIAAQKSVNTLLSGPAGGVLAAEFLSKITDYHNIITGDLGGTSFDVGIVQNGSIGITGEGVIEGFPVKFPHIDITTIGAGGGSIAWLDAGGALRVGPRSAGAVPGPVCYSKGGTEPTVTDAHAVLGRVGEKLLGGKMHLDVAAARKAIEEKLAVKLNMTVEEVAEGILRVANSNMVRAIRVNTRNTPVEVLERIMPVKVIRYGLAPNSEGPGKHRGGFGIERVLEFQTDEVDCFIASDRVNTAPWGLNGGKAALGARFTVNRADGTEEHLPSKARVRFYKKDRLYIQTSGGGGWGNPLERDKKALKCDVKDGLISQERAEKEYGGC